MGVDSPIYVIEWVAGVCGTSRHICNTYLCVRTICFASFTSLVKMPSYIDYHSCVIYTSGYLDAEMDQLVAHCATIS